MLKKDITFTDFDGNEQTETHYFNLSKTELIELKMEFEGGLEDQIKQMIAEEDNLKLFRKFKEIIIASYGRREGNSFIKDEEEGKLFAGSIACDEFIYSFFTDVENAAEFIRGIVPRELSRELPEDLEAAASDAMLPPPPTTA